MPSILKPYKEAPAQVFSLGGSTTQVVMDGSAKTLLTAVDRVRVINVRCAVLFHINAGEDPDDPTSTTAMLIPADTDTRLGVEEGHTVKAIGASGTVTITEMWG